MQPTPNRRLTNGGFFCARIWLATEYRPPIRL